jgi:hypothetical protein
VVIGAQVPATVRRPSAVMAGAATDGELADDDP